MRSLSASRVPHAAPTSSRPSGATEAGPAAQEVRDGRVCTQVRHKAANDGSSAGCAGGMLTGRPRCRQHEGRETGACCARCALTAQRHASILLEQRPRGQRQQLAGSVHDGQLAALAGLEQLHRLLRGDGVCMKAGCGGAQQGVSWHAEGGYECRLHKK